MLRRLTDKEIIETMLEVQSHSGLPIKTFGKEHRMLKSYKRTFLLPDDYYHSLANYLKNDIIKVCMIKTHKNRRRNINNNIKSYDWS